MNNKIRLSKLHDNLYINLFHKDIFPQDLVFYIEVIPNNQLTELVDLELRINEICNEQ